MDKGKRNHTSGLHNLGNTCYMNSLLQCLAHSPSLMNFITDHEFEEDLRADSENRSFTTECRNLLIQLWIREGILDPRQFKHHADRGILNRDGFGHMIGRQNDAHEFLEFILDALHTSLQYEPKISISVGGDDDSLSETDRMAIEAYTRWKGDFRGGYSGIVDLFYGQFLSEVRKGDEISRCFDPFQVLSLQLPQQMPPDKEISIMDCLEDFMSTEKINEQISKRFYFWKTPKNLIISLKRFCNDGSKDQRRVVYRDTLDLSKYSKGYKREKAIYSLYGICCHQGGANGGHYISLCRKQGFNQWYKHDDTAVTRLGEGGALPLTSSAYILFYHLV